MAVSRYFPSLLEGNWYTSQRDFEIDFHILDIIGSILKVLGIKIDILGLAK
jgi:hypothetical protein